MIDCRLIVDPPAEGAWNMAVDEILLHEANTRGIAAVRFYQWREPTLSLGYFQPHAQRDEHAASRPCPVVRRASGGGAILHDRELTYSIALPQSHRLARRAERLYCIVHQSIAQILAELAINAQVRSPDDVPPIGDEPFLCFERRAPGDLSIGDHKIAGSAQRRRRGAVLQHGSILLARSAMAPELPGIADLTDQAIGADRLLTLWQSKLAVALNARLRQERMADHELQAAKRLTEEQFGHDAWTCRR